MVWVRVIFLAAFFVYIWIGLYSLYKSRFSLFNRFFFVINVLMGISSILYLILCHQMISLEFLHFIAKLTRIVTELYVMFCVVLVLIFTERKIKLGYAIFILSIKPFIVFVYLFVFNASEIVFLQYGYEMEFINTNAGHLFNFINYFFGILSLILFIEYFFRNINIIKRRQTLTIIFGVMLTIIYSLTAMIFVKGTRLGFLFAASLQFIPLTVGLYIAAGYYRLLGVSLSIAAKEIIHNIAESFVLLDYDFSIKTVNESFTNLTNYTDDKLKEMRIESLFVDQDFAMRIYSEDIHNESVQIISKSGKLIPILFSSTILRDKFDILGVICVLRDMSDIYEYQENLKSLNRRLEKQNELLEAEVDKRSQELQSMMSQLSEAEEKAALSGLISGITHEINTPLGLSLTTSSFLKEKMEKFFADMDNKSDEELKASLLKFNNSINIIDINLKRAVDMVESFKKISIDQSNRKIKEFDLISYINDILFSLKPIFKPGGHSVMLEAPKELFIKSYPGAFAQVLTNLINNSVIHGFSDNEIGSIKIKIKTDFEKLYLEYSDNGIGMSKDVLDNIYKIYYTTNEANGGSGLGMNIVYNIVKSTLKGTIDCESSIGDGVKFTIIVPLVLS